MNAPTHYACYTCQGSGYVLALHRTDQETRYGAPIAFRCSCSLGRSKGATGIPLWSEHYNRVYEPTQALVCRPEEKPEEKKEEKSEAPLTEHDEKELMKELALEEEKPKGLPDHAVIKLSQCLDRATKGIPLPSQSEFRALMGSYGQDAVRAALKGLRVADAAKRAGVSGHPVSL